MKKIISTKVPGAPNKGGAGAPAPSIPSVRTPQNTTNGINPATQGVNQIDIAEATFKGQGTIRAYVTTGDVNTSQEAEAKINSRRTVS